MLRNDADVVQSKATCLQINIKKAGNFLSAKSSSRSLSPRSVLKVLERIWEHEPHISVLVLSLLSLDTFSVCELLV